MVTTNIETWLAVYCCEMPAARSGRQMAKRLQREAASHQVANSDRQVKRGARQSPRMHKWYELDMPLVSPSLSSRVHSARQFSSSVMDRRGKLYYIQ